MDYNVIAKFLIKLRKEKKLTQEKLANILNVDRATISKWERAIYIPTVEMMVKLSEFYNISVNEIVYGARRTDENKKDLDNISLEVLKQNTRNVRKVTILSSIIIFIIIAILPIMYLISNYDAIKIYKVGGNSNYYNVFNGMLITTKGKSYLKLSTITPTDSQDEVIALRLYYLKDNKKVVLSNRKDNENIIVNVYGYNEFFKYKEMDKFMNSTYIEVISKNHSEEIKLQFMEVEANDQFIYTENEDISSEIDNTFEQELPKYIKENFTYDKEEKLLTYKYNQNDINVTEKYNYRERIYHIIESNAEYELLYFYALDDSQLRYIFLENDTTFRGTYNLNTKQCITKKCDSKLVDKFINEYYNKVNET